MCGRYYVDEKMFRELKRLICQMEYEEPMTGEKPAALRRRKGG